MKKWTSEEEKKLIDFLKNGLNYQEISINMNRTSRSIKEKTNKMGYTMNSFTFKKDIICLNCEKCFSVSGRDKRGIERKFCSQSCSATYNNKKRLKITKNNKIKDEGKDKGKDKCLTCSKDIKRGNKYCSLKCKILKEYNDYILRWKNGEETGLKGEYSISNHIKKYLFKKYNNKCALCEWCEINKYTNKIPLEVEHIDGDYKNNKEENLTLICPNCHSLTKTYKGSNKGYGRKNRNKYQIL